MEAVWIALGGNAAFLVVVALFGKKIVTHWLDKDLNRFKQQIQQACTLEVEKLRGALAIASSEHAILLTHLQSRRANVIDELYKRLAVAIATSGSLFSLFEFAGENSKDAKSKSPSRHCSLCAITSIRNKFGCLPSLASVWQH
jgi:hypothetical protein